MFYNFFRGISHGGFKLLRPLLKNPITIILYGFFSKWYLIITFSGVIVVFWVYNGLKDIGVIDKIEHTLNKAIYESKSVAQNCVPRILKLTSFWHCINHLPPYKPLTKEDLKKLKEQSMQNDKQTYDNELDELINPYQDSVDNDE